MSEQVEGAVSAPPARSRFDWVLEAVALAALVGVFVLAWMYWDQLPNAVVPRRRFGPPRSLWSTVWTFKNGLFLVMGLNTLAYLGLTVTGQSQKAILVPAELDKAAPHIRPMMFSLVIVLKTVLMLFALYLTWALVAIGTGGGAMAREWFSGWSLTAFVLCVPLPLVLVTLRLRR